MTRIIRCIWIAALVLTAAACGGEAKQSADDTLSDAEKERVMKMLGNDPTMLQEMGEEGGAMAPGGANGAQQPGRQQGPRAR